MRVLLRGGIKRGKRFWFSAGLILFVAVFVLTLAAIPDEETAEE